MPLHPNVRRCTHIQVTGHRCGSPALKQEYFCYFHTRMIKGVQTRVDSQIQPIALIESAEAIQAALMHMIDAVLKGTIDNKRAALVLKALYIAVRNSRNVYFSIRQDDMVHEVPNYAHQYLSEHPESNPHAAPSFDTSKAQGDLQQECHQQECHPEEAQAFAKRRPANEGSLQVPADADTARTPPVTPQATSRSNRAAPTHKAPEGTRQKAWGENTPPLTTHQSERWNEIKKLEASIENALHGDWRELRTVFNAVGLAQRKPPTRQTPKTSREISRRCANSLLESQPKSALNLDPRNAAEDNCEPEVRSQ